MAEGDQEQSTSQMFKKIMEKLTNLDNKMDNLQQEVKKDMKTLQDENQKLKETVQRQELKIEALEMETRKKNLIIFNVKEEPEENVQILLQTVIGITENMEVQITRGDIDFIYRVGKQQTGKTRPIKVGLTSRIIRTEILKNVKKLKGLDIGISEDFDKKTVDIRKKLKTHMQDARKKGYKAIIRHDKLWIGQEELTLKQLEEQERTAFKRAKEDSPPTADKNIEQERKKIKENETSNEEKPVETGTKKKEYIQTLLKGNPNEAPKTPKNSRKP